VPLLRRVTPDTRARLARVRAQTQLAAHDARRGLPRPECRGPEASAQELDCENAAAESGAQEWCQAYTGLLQCSQTRCSICH